MVSARAPPTIHAGTIRSATTPWWSCAMPAPMTSPARHLHVWRERRISPKHTPGPEHWGTWRRTDVTFPWTMTHSGTVMTTIVFTVTVSAPNGAADQHAANDQLPWHFDLPVVYNYIFVLDYRTNNRPQENTVTVRDIQGASSSNALRTRANTQYRDTLDLPPGCYTLRGSGYWQRWPFLLGGHGAGTVISGSEEAEHHREELPSGVRPQDPLGLHHTAPP